MPRPSVNLLAGFSLAIAAMALSIALFVFAAPVVGRRGTNSASSSPTADVAVACSAALFFIAVSCGYLAVRETSRELRLATLRANFVAGITHDLKTPLTSISLLAETLRCGRVAQDACPDVLDTIVHETQRLHQIVENALSSARIESGAHAYYPQLVTAQNVVRGAARRFDDALLAGGFGLEESYSSEPVLVRVDPDAFQHAVLNLLSNAAKYSGASREIRLSVDRDDENARISVEDAGIGIEGREHRRIFEPFYRSPGSGLQNGGAGLGLAAVRHFATAHAGRAEVVSEPGIGSRFEILLPLVLRNVSGDDRHG